MGSQNSVGRAKCEWFLAGFIHWVSAAAGVGYSCRPRILVLVRKLVAAGMLEHMGMGLDLEPSGLASFADQLLEVAHGRRRAALGHEHERRLAFGLAVQAAQCAQLPAGQWMC